MTEHVADRRLFPVDYIVLGVFSLLLFGYSMVGGRPLTMHEAVLPQSAREMLADHDWIVPKSGGRPWLDRPPLPRWITVAVASVWGRCDREWIVRLAPALLGSFIVLMVAWMAAGWFGRTIGLISGLVLATMHEFGVYARLAEEDIFLCAIVTGVIALFVKLEIFGQGERGKAEGERDSVFGWRSFVGGRSAAVWMLFVLLGMTNLAKGLLFGTAMAIIPIAGFLLFSGEPRRIGRYVWLWGWLVAGMISIAWPIATYLRHPEVIELWLFDHLGRLDGSYSAITQPIWYYPVTLLWTTAPWTLVAGLGLRITAAKAFGDRRPPERFLWCWAILPIVVFSIPSGKHHHYLIQCLVPWAILASLGLVWFWERVGVCYWGLSRSSGKLILGTFLVGVAMAQCWGYSVIAPRTDHCLADTEFLRRVSNEKPADARLMINADLGSMDFFRILFYLPDDAIPLHNLTYLRDENLEQTEVYIVTRRRDEKKLAELGTPEIMLMSRYSRRERSPDDRLTLFRLRFRSDIEREPVPDYITPMQALGRQEGPFVGTRL